MFANIEVAQFMSDIRGFTSLKLCLLNEVIFFNESGIESDFKNLSLSKTFHLYDFGMLSREFVSLCNGDSWSRTQFQCKPNRTMV